METEKSINLEFQAKLARLEKLTALVDKIEIATLGEDPQMRKEYSKLKKLALKEMISLNRELKVLADQNLEMQV